MAVSYYNIGTATLTQGSAAMTGQGTLWSGNVRPGDTVVSYSGQTAIVGTVNSNTSITLTRAFRGTSQTAAAYEIVFAPADASVAQDVSTVLNAIRASALVGLSGLTPAARKLPYYNAASTAALTDLTEAARAMLALAGAADRLPYFTGANTADVTPLTALGRSLLGSVSGAAVYTALGSVPRAQMPSGLAATTTNVTDWNSATDNGWYSGNGASNAPPSAMVGTAAVVYGRVIAFSTQWIVQEVWGGTSSPSDADTRSAMRVCASGVWGAWFKLQRSQAEADTRNDARYLASGVSVSVPSLAAANNITVAGGASGTGANNGKTFGSVNIDSSSNTVALAPHLRFFNPNGLVGSITTTGSATAYGTGSDYRLKQDDEPIAGAIARLNQLRPVTFAWRADPAGPKVDGFIAHEVQLVVPEAVIGQKDAMVDVGTAVIDGEVVAASIPEAEAPEGSTWTRTGTRPAYQAIDQAKLVPLLTAALQAAVAKIDNLESRVTALEG